MLTREVFTLMIKTSKGQFYILTAIIFCVIVFALVYTENYVGNTDTNFKNIYDNYIYESSNVINSAVYYNRNISDEFENYTTTFINYAKTKNVNLKIFYIIATKTNTIVGNHLGEEINLTDYKVENNNYIILGRLNNLSLNYENNIYEYNLSSDEEVIFKALLIRK